MVSSRASVRARWALFFPGLFLVALIAALLALFPASGLCAAEDEPMLSIGGEWSFDEEGAPLYISRSFSFMDILAEVSGSEIRGRSDTISIYGTIEGDYIIVDISYQSSGTSADVYWDAKDVALPLPEEGGGRTYSDVVPISISYSDRDSDEGGLYSGTLRLEASLRGTLVPGEETEAGGEEEEGAAQEEPGDTIPGEAGSEGEALPEGDRETWWGAVVTMLVGMTALIGAGVTLIGSASRTAFDTALQAAQQAGLPRMAEEQMVREALRKECDQMRRNGQMSNQEFKDFVRWLADPDIPAGEIILRKNMVKNSERDYSAFKKELSDFVLEESVELVIDIVSPYNKAEMIWDMYDTPSDAMDLVLSYKNAPAPEFDMFVETYRKNLDWLTGKRDELTSEYWELQKRVDLGWKGLRGEVDTLRAQKGGDPRKAYEEFYWKAQHRLKTLEQQIKAINTRLNRLGKERIR